MLVIGSLAFNFCNVAMTHFLNDLKILHLSGQGGFYSCLSHQQLGVLFVAQWVTNATSIHEDSGSIPSPAQWVGSGMAVSCGVAQMRLRSGIAMAVV